MFINILKIVTFASMSFFLGFYFNFIPEKKTDSIKTLKENSLTNIVIPNYIQKDLDKFDDSWEEDLLLYLATEKKEINQVNSQKSKKEILDILLNKGKIDLSLINELISMGVDLNKKDETGQSFMFKLLKNVKEFTYDDLKILLDHEKVDIFGKSFKYINPPEGFYFKNLDLIVAALSNDNPYISLAIVNILEEKGLSFYNNDYRIHLLAIKNSPLNKRYLEKILPYIDINTMLTEDISLFSKLISLDIENHEISNYLDENVRIDSSVLISAVISNTISLNNIQRIIEKGGNPKAHNSEALHTALKYGKLNIAEILIKNGADITANGKINPYDYLTNIKLEEKREEYRLFFNKYVNKK